MKRTYEPFWWTLFSAGGTIAAFVLPVLMLVFGVAVPMGWMKPITYSDIFVLVDNLLIRLILFGVISLSMFHWAHRFRYTLYEGLQLHRFKAVILYACYGSAVFFSALSLYIMFF